MLTSFFLFNYLINIRSYYKVEYRIIHDNDDNTIFINKLKSTKIMKIKSLTLKFFRTRYYNITIFKLKKK